MRVSKYYFFWLNFPFTIIYCVFDLIILGYSVSVRFRGLKSIDNLFVLKCKKMSIIAYIFFITNLNGCAVSMATESFLKHLLHKRSLNRADLLIPVAGESESKRFWVLVPKDKWQAFC